jgi:hypothetical protein
LLAGFADMSSAVSLTRLTLRAPGTLGLDALAMSRRSVRIPRFYHVQSPADCSDDGPDTFLPPTLVSRVLQSVYYEICPFCIRKFVKLNK